MIASGSKRKHRYAVIAAEAYVETVERDGFADDVLSVPGIMPALSIGGVQMSGRALQLARSVNRMDLARRAAAALLSFCDRHGDPQHDGIWFAPFDLLYGSKGPLSPGQEGKIISDLETMLARTSSRDGGMDFNPFGAQEAAERLIKHYKNQEHTKRLVKAYGTAFERMSQEAAPLLATAWLQPIIERYEQVGLKTETEELTNFATEKAKQIPGGRKSYSVEVSLDRNLIEGRTDVLLSGGRITDQAPSHRGRVCTHCGVSKASTRLRPEKCAAYNID